MSRILVTLGLIVVGVGGVQLLTLESEAGNTVAEAYYNQMGWLGIGLALMILSLFIVLDSRARSSSRFGGPSGECPSCHQFISQQAQVCPYCQTRFGVPTTPVATEGE